MKKTIFLATAMLMLSIGISSATTTKNYVSLDSQSATYLDMSAYASGYWLELVGVNGTGAGCEATISSDGQQITWSAPGQPRITFSGGPSYSTSPSYVPAGCTHFRVEGAIQNGTSTTYVGKMYAIRYN